MVLLPLHAGIAALVVIRVVLPWVAATIYYFRRAKAPPVDGVVSLSIAGALLWIGLALTAFEVPAAGALIAGGIIGGLTSFAATVVTTRGISTGR